MPPALHKLFSPKLAGLCGVVGPLLSFASILLAISISPWFNWTDKALSNLGDLTQTSAPLFNGGLIAGGLILVFFVLGLVAKVRNNMLCAFGTVFLFVAAMGVIGVGVFPMNFPLPHAASAISIFVSDPIALFLFGVAFALRRSTKLLSATCFAMCIVAFFVWFLPWGAGIAIPEFIAVFALYVFIFIVSARLIMGKEIIPKK